MAHKPPNRIIKTRSLKSKVHVIGVGGHARAVVALLQDLSFEVAHFHGENILENEEICGVRGTSQNVPENGVVALAIGNNVLRKQKFQHYNAQIGNALVHPSAFVSKSAELGKGTLVFPKAIIHTLATIKQNCIVNTGAIVEHESIIGNHTHISVGAIVCGRSKIGDNCFIGAGAIIKDQISIADNVILGAGAVAVSNIVEPGIYVGIPAKKMKN